MHEQVQEVVDRFHPELSADGGDIELVDVEDGVVKLMRQGMCVECRSSMRTLAMGIEELLKAID